MEHYLKKKLVDIMKELNNLRDKYSLKFIIFTLGDTKVENNQDTYFTTIRIGKNFVVIGAVVFSELEGNIFLKKSMGFLI